MSSRRLSDLMQIVKSLPGPVLGIFIPPPVIEIAPQQRDVILALCLVCGRHNEPHRKPIFNNRCVYWMKLVLSFKMSQNQLLTPEIDFNPAFLMNALHTKSS